ncbi:tRNA threonylcarbamoyladenosine dehydratase [Selenomonas sp. TAMA-11512]|uniref:tRNA threonylcarbamoyladenosine dehydratase n=1 Tax=Selenomonas sp. TAMA-11512 TaxID=3095337 RepID=UPI00308D266C|nr:tRNA threonylcarbamoyladenosine dehydratase [Selenomonas sp. TAMA-11512]
MEERLARTALLVGEERVERLRDKTVAVFGVGGVGSYTIEALARSGVGHLVLIDKDDVDATNINRQLPALSTTVGQRKAEVMAARVKTIAPEIEVDVIDAFYLPDTAEDFFRMHYDYVVDAIDNMAAKVSLAVETEKRGIPCAASMGAANKLDPARFEVADIYATSVCPMARIMRKKLREYGVQSLTVVYSKEEPCRRDGPPGSVPFVPPVAGMILAGVVIKDLMGLRPEEVR